MLTPLQIKALDNYKAIFRKLWKYPFDWNSQTKLFEHVKNPQQLVVWILVTTFVIFLSVGCGAIFLVFQQLYAKQVSVPLHFVGACLLEIMLSMITVLVSICAFKLRDDIPLAWNQMYKI